MQDESRFPVAGVLLAAGVVVVGILVIGGFLFATYVQAERARAEAAVVAAEEARMERMLERLPAEVELARGGSIRTGPLLQQPTVRETIDLIRDIDAALRGADGRRRLQALGQLVAQDQVDYPRIVAAWTELTNMGSAALDRLDLSRLDLASALADSPGVMRFVLDSADLDPTLRQFTARTLEQASTKVRRRILDDLDFSTEKDRRVLHAVVRATEGVADAAYVDRFVLLVQRTDLYNDSRSSIAFRIAEIEGPESRAAIDRLRADSGGKGLFERMLPVLENIHTPPASGLLVTNGVRPAVDRIGHNDLILEYAGQAIRTRADLTRADAKTRPGQVVSVRILRGGVKKILRVSVSDKAPGHLHFDARPVVKR